MPLACMSMGRGMYVPAYATIRLHMHTYAYICKHTCPPPPPVGVGAWIPAYANICIHMHTPPPLWGWALGGDNICRCHACPWVPACMSLHMQTFAYTCTHVHTYESIDHAYASTYIHIHTDSCIYIPMPRHAYVHAYTCPCRGMHMCMNLHAYVIPSLGGTNQA